MIKFKKVFMFANYTPSDDSIGITKKIRSEINTLRKMGMEVWYTGYEKQAVAVFDNDDNVVFRKDYPFSNEAIHNRLRYFWLEYTASVFLNENGTFDLGYIRMGPPNFLMFRILSELKKNTASIVAESLAYFPGIKYKSFGGKYISLCYKLNGHRLKKYLSYYLCEGELTELFGVPAYTMNMGVDVESIKPHRYTGVKNELNLISVANENVYHAYDRIIESVNAYKGEIKVYVHFVGTVSEQTKSLIKKYGLNNQIIVYGKQSGDELDLIYNKCNVGLGPFGQHRVGGKKDTGLKTKEYFAKGLPYIYSGEEPSVPKNYPYICSFPSDESRIDFDKVWEFYMSYSEDINVVSNMRSFAYQYYSWDKIMAEALSHFS